jgi:hypothetical protein
VIVFCPQKWEVVEANLDGDVVGFGDGVVDLVWCECVWGRIVGSLVQESHVRIGWL